MFICFGIIAGLLGSAPLFFAMNKARLNASTNSLSLGLFGLGGVCISLVILVAALVVVALNAKDQLVFFAVSETVAFLGCTIAYFVWRILIKGTRRTKEE